MERRKPSKEEILQAAGKSLPDLIAPQLKVLLCGINPGLYSAAVQHHFARPGNRFWPALYKSGFTAELFTPDREHELLKDKIGITNIAQRATASASELSASELIAGKERLLEKAKIYQPKLIAVLGITAYKTAFGEPKASYGLQKTLLHKSQIWVLPSPSGLNAHFSPAKLATSFSELFLFLYS